MKDELKHRPVVLVAEDDDISYAYLEVLLSFENCVIMRTTDGEQTVETVKNHPEIELVLMDLRMPVMDGIAATYEIRSFNKKIPIIAQTAYVFESDQIEAINAGCSEYISKPVRKNEFLKKIRKYLDSCTFDC